MKQASPQHGREHQDWLFLYALRALSPNEISIAEAQVSRCAECRRQLESLRPTLESFTFWPTNVLRPSASLWGRLAGRIAQETGRPPVSPPSETSRKPQWEEPAPGIFCQLLATDTEKGRVSMLVRLNPGVDYPPHRHAGLEELYLLDGELKIDEKTVRPGDYVRAEVDTVDHRVWSETGCTCVLITSTRDVIL
jgi:quercetin dioxygenase-like cupin family protein